MYRRSRWWPVTAVVAAAVVCSAPTASADGDINTFVPNNKRLNDSVVADVFTAQHHAGCHNDVRANPQLQAAAQRHAKDVLGNANLNGDIGSDGSSPQTRAEAAGFRGPVAETVAINPALAINSVEVMQQWFANPAYLGIMSNCNNSQVGVWSENSLSRSVLVAVYGPAVGAAPQGDLPLDLSPDYDASDEVEHGLDWYAWILRGVNPAPGYPPQ